VDGPAQHVAGALKWNGWGYSNAGFMIREDGNIMFKGEMYVDSYPLLRLVVAPIAPEVLRSRVGSRGLLGLATDSCRLVCRFSLLWCGYWQRSGSPTEITIACQWCLMCFRSGWCGVVWVLGAWILHAGRGLGFPIASS
jgi:hypothetical protein